MIKHLKFLLLFLFVTFFLFGCAHHASLVAGKQYFLACKDDEIITITYNINDAFKKGDLFEVVENDPSALSTMIDKGLPCWSDSGKLTYNLMIYYKNHGWQTGSVDLQSGCWFKSEKDITIKTSHKYSSEGLFENSLDKIFVDNMCSPHSSQFSVDGNMFTDVTMGKTEQHLGLVEADLRQAEEERLLEEAKRKIHREQMDARWEEIQKKSQEENRVLQDKREKLQAELKRYGAEALVPINMLEVNPYEFEGRTIAVVVQFKKMLSKNSASFYSGYSDMEDHTNVYDEIIITGIPTGTHFESGPFSPRMMLALEGKGTIVGTNAFGARIKAPYFQWIAIMSGKQKSVFEEQREINRKQTLQNDINSRRKYGE